jgi:hypothetical protein
MMRISTFFMAALIATLALSTTQTVAEEQVYRWVDKDGVVHFDPRPEGQADAEVVDINKAPDYDSRSDPEPSSPYVTDPQPSYAQKQRAEREQGLKEAAEKQKEMDVLCQNNRDRVATLEPVVRVMYKQEDGSVIRMDDNDRLGMIAESKAFIAENCNK